MIKNDFNDGLAEELLTSLDKINKYNLTDTNLKLEELFKKYLNFDSDFLSTLSITQLETIFVHPKIKDYSKFTILGVLFVKQWTLCEQNDNTFYKLLKGFYILSHIYLNDKDTKIPYYINDLMSSCEELSHYDLDNNALYTLVKIYAKHEDYTKVDDISFELLKKGKKYKDDILEIYNSMMSHNEDFLSTIEMTKDEIQSAIEEIKRL